MEAGEKREGFDREAREVREGRAGLERVEGGYEGGRGALSRGAEDGVVD